jgi:hypothetical protein
MGLLDSLYGQGDYADAGMILPYAITPEGERVLSFPAPVQAAARTVARAMGDLPLDIDPETGLPAENALMDAFDLSGAMTGLGLLAKRPQGSIGMGGSEDIAALRRQANIERFGYDPNEASVGLLDEPDVSYRMEHQPRGPEDDLPVRLDDLTKSTTGEAAGFPDDFYTPEGRRIFAPGPRFDNDEFGVAGQQSYRAILASKGNPDAEVTIYRGVPNDPNINTINRGDFVTLSPKYAELHAASGYGRSGDEPGKVISQKVKVKDIYWDGNDVNEFGYFPPKKQGILY